MRYLFIIALAFATLLISCGKEQKKRGLNYDELKASLTLNDDQVAKFDELVVKYKAMSESNRAANMSEGGQMNRVAFFTKMEDILKSQAEEMKQLLDEKQMEAYTEFMEKNTRKRPRYNDELLANIKSTLELDDNQAKVLEAANNAFEKEFQDAHDIYHGNNELANEYWQKFDTQRRKAIEKVLTEEQIDQFNELVKDVKSPGER